MDRVRVAAEDGRDGRVRPARMLAHDRGDGDAFRYDEGHGVDGDGDRAAPVVGVGRHAQGDVRCVAQRGIGRRSSAGAGRHYKCAYARHCVVVLLISAHSRRSGLWCNSEGGRSSIPWWVGVKLSLLWLPKGKC